MLIAMRSAAVAVPAHAAKADGAEGSAGTKGPITYGVLARPDLFIATTLTTYSRPKVSGAPVTSSVVPWACVHPAPSKLVRAIVSTM